MSMIKEFKEFALRGNVMDLAIGIIIGGAFGKIVTSFVADIVMPPIGLLVGGIKFTDIKVNLKDAVLDSSGKIINEAVTLNIGNFIQAAFDFLIIVLVIFLMIKAINKMSKKQEAEEAPLIVTKEEELLTEIRDILKEK
jgi:large conductance mechanosensitive channel